MDADAPRNNRLSMLSITSNDNNHNRYSTSSNSSNDESHVGRRSSSRFSFGGPKTSSNKRGSVASHRKSLLNFMSKIGSSRRGSKAVGKDEQYNNRASMRQSSVFGPDVAVQLASPTEATFYTQRPSLGNLATIDSDAESLASRGRKSAMGETASQRTFAPSPSRSLSIPAHSPLLSANSRMSSPIPTAWTRKMPIKVAKERAILYTELPTLLAGQSTKSFLSIGAQRKPSGWGRRLYVLTPGTLLRYQPALEEEDEENRTPDQVLDITESTICHVSDAIQGSKWTLKVAPGGGAEPWYLVMENTDDLMKWMNAVREQIRVAKEGDKESVRSATRAALEGGATQHKDSGITVGTPGTEEEVTVLQAPPKSSKQTRTDGDGDGMHNVRIALNAFQISKPEVNGVETITSSQLPFSTHPGEQPAGAWSAMASPTDTTFGPNSGFDFQLNAIGAVDSVLAAPLPVHTHGFFAAAEGRRLSTPDTRRLSVVSTGTAISSASSVKSAHTGTFGHYTTKGDGNTSTPSTHRGLRHKTSMQALPEQKPLPKATTLPALPAVPLSLNPSSVAGPNKRKSKNASRAPSSASTSRVPLPRQHSHEGRRERPVSWVSVTSDSSGTGSGRRPSSWFVNIGMTPLPPGVQLDRRGNILSAPTPPPVGPLPPPPPSKMRTVESREE
ncbi:hypothetical protein YB2330_002501 [Saitoella coloradoensis]